MAGMFLADRLERIVLVKGVCHSEQLVLRSYGFVPHVECSNKICTETRVIPPYRKSSERKVVDERISFFIEVLRGEPCA